MPIVVKISPDINDEQVEKITEVLFRYDIKAIIVSNTTEANREVLKNIQKNEKGGLSGKPLEVKSNQLINKFQSTKNFYYLHVERESTNSTYLPKNASFQTFWLK